MSGMAIKFTSLAQIEANQFIPAEDRLSQKKPRISEQACHACGGAITLWRTFCRRLPMPQWPQTGLCARRGQAKARL